MTDAQRDVIKTLMLANWREHAPAGMQPRSERPSDEEMRLCCLLLIRRANLGKLEHEESLLLADIALALLAGA